MLGSLLLLLCLGSSLVSCIGYFWSDRAKTVNEKEPFPTEYGVDHTTPIHHLLDSKSFYGKRYDTMMKGCYDKFSRRECDANERARIEMNFDQPRMQHNYTELGFKKIKCPKEVWEPLMAYYNMNKHEEHLENWPRGNTYVNNWESPTYMISFENKKLRGDGYRVKQEIWNAFKPTLEEWTGKKLIESSLYGIRVYKDGAVLATHVDRLPLVSSAIINVDQDIDEPWPVEVYGHDGKAYNVTMQPGDAVLYESHTVLHGRPFPLKGRFYANVFVHFIPIDHDQVNEQDHALAKEKARLPVTSQNVKESIEKVKDLLSNTRNRLIGGHEHHNHDEETIQRHMDTHDKEEAMRKKVEDMNRDEVDPGREEEDEEEEEEGEPDGRTALHLAAVKGDLELVEKLLGNHNTDLLHAKDENDWQALHEAVREGHYEVVKYLVDMGADISATTSNGGTPLWWAKRLLDANHPVITYLEEIGAPDVEGLVDPNEQ